MSSTVCGRRTAVYHHVVEHRATRDPALLPELLASSLDSLYRMARAAGALPDRAEEAVQETCRIALERVRQYRGEGPLFGWVARIAWREGSKRAARARAGPLPGTLAALGVDPTEVASLREERGRLERALDALAPPQRAAILLQSAEGLSCEEIARVLGRSVGTVWSDLSRARTRLREILSSGGERT
ncbi:MAG: RNA polymerase sigma factor [Planctomycetes bacterium]|nr:RNA polymerase sigma factor [Planctomycetota bacterium]